MKGTIMEGQKGMNNKRTKRNERTMREQKE